MTSSPAPADAHRHDGPRWDPDALGVIMAPFTGTTLPAWTGEALDAGLASVILFGHNTPDPETTAALARCVHERAADCVVAIDEEGGDVTRIQAGTGSPLTTAWALGEVDDLRLSRASGRALGGILAACDIDLDLAPVLDVSTDPANPVIGTRAFGAEGELVARHAAAVAGGLGEAGVGSCAKHFPGHGATSTDSHTGLPVITLGREQFEREHLAPWRAVAGGAMDAVMTAHVEVPALGEGPASIAPWSRPLLEQAVGDSSPGFPGLIVTDALDMAAVAADPGFGEAAVRAIEAGADLLCLGTSIRRDDAAMLREAHDALLGAVASGRLPREVLARRAERTRGLARALRARRREVPAPRLADALQKATAIGADVARRAVRWADRPSTVQEVEQGGPAAAPLDADAPVVVVDLRVRADHASGARSPQLLAALEGAGLPAQRAEDAAHLPPGTQLLALTRLPRADAGEAERLAALLDQYPATIVVHTGVPAAAPEHDRVILAHGAGRTMMRAAVDLLLSPGS